MQQVVHIKQMCSQTRISYKVLDLFADDTSLNCWEKFARSSIVFFFFELVSPALGTSWPVRAGEKPATFGSVSVGVQPKNAWKSSEEFLGVWIVFKLLWRIILLFECAEETYRCQGVSGSEKERPECSLWSWQHWGSSYRDWWEDFSPAAAWDTRDILHSLKHPRQRPTTLPTSSQTFERLWITQINPKMFEFKEFVCKLFMKPAKNPSKNNSTVNGQIVQGG